MLLLRSIVAPLVLVAANVLSFAATMGVSAIAFNHVFGFPGSDPSTPLYGFVFLVALGIDYSIFLMTRVREESRTRGTRPGILVGLAVTGGVITSAGIVLASTFSALAVLPILFLVQIAFIVAFGVLLDTLVVRSLLVPAVSYDLGDRIWWPFGLHAGRPSRAGRRAGRRAEGRHQGPRGRRVRTLGRIQPGLPRWAWSAVATRGVSCSTSSHSGPPRWMAAAGKRPLSSRLMCSRSASSKCG